MPNTLILTFMGADRPGLVSQLAACIADHGGNWIESRLVRLGGQFSGVLRIAVAESEAERLSQALRDLEEAGLKSLCILENDSLQPEPSTRLLNVEILGSDRPGILKAISQVLARHSVNIEELSTERRAAPMSGELLFQARAIVNLPAGTPLASLRQDLEKIAGDLMVDLVLDEATAPA